MELFYNFCAETSVHGLNHIRKGKSKVVNVIWLVVFVLALCASMAGVIKVFLVYSSRPMSTDYRIVANNSMELPSLSVCAMSFISKTRMRRMGMSQGLQTSMVALENALYFGLGFDFHRPALELDAVRREYEEILQREDIQDFEALLMRLSTSCGEMFSECAMGNREFDCCTTMRQFLFPAKCITLAAKGFLDPRDAWQYTIALNWPARDEELMASVITARSREFSLMLNRGERAMMGAKPIGYAQPGNMYTIQVRMRMYESVNNPPVYSCVEQPAEGYDTDSCMEECIISGYFSNDQQSLCPCQASATFKARPIRRVVGNTTVEVEGHKPLCDPWQLGECQAAMQRLQENKTKEQLEAEAEKAERLKANSYESCQKSCPRTCKKVAYYAKMLTTKNDPDIVADYMRNLGYPQGFEHLLPSFSSHLFANLFIFTYTVVEAIDRARNASFVILKYDEMEYKHTKQQLAMSGETVLSYLGGQLGLFLGGSLLTLGHAVLFVVQYCCQGAAEAGQLKPPKAKPPPKHSLASHPPGTFSNGNVGERTPSRGSTPTRAGTPVRAFLKDPTLHKDYAANI